MNPWLNEQKQLLQKWDVFLNKIEDRIDACNLSKYELVRVLEKQRLYNQTLPEKYNCCGNVPTFQRLSICLLTRVIFGCPNIVGVCNDSRSQWGFEFDLMKYQTSNYPYVYRLDLEADFTLDLVDEIVDALTNFEKRKIKVGHIHFYDKFTEGDNPYVDYPYIGLEYEAA